MFVIAILQYVSDKEEQQIKILNQCHRVLAVCQITACIYLGFIVTCHIMAEMRCDMQARI